MVGAIPRQPRRFWGVPDWQASAASCAKDRLLRGREADPETSRGENCGGSQDGLHWWALYRRVEVGRNMCGLSRPAPTESHCPGLCPDHLWISPRMQILQRL